MEEEGEELGPPATSDLGGVPWKEAVELHAKLKAGSDAGASRKEGEMEEDDDEEDEGDEEEDEEDEDEEEESSDGNVLLFRYSLEQYTFTFVNKWQLFISQGQIKAVKSKGRKKTTEVLGWRV